MIPEIVVILLVFSQFCFVFKRNCSYITDFSQVLFRIYEAINITKPRKKSVTHTVYIYIYIY